MISKRIEIIDSARKDRKSERHDAVRYPLPSIWVGISRCQSDDNDNNDEAHQRYAER